MHPSPLRTDLVLGRVFVYILLSLRPSNQSAAFREKRERERANVRDTLKIASTRESGVGTSLRPHRAESCINVSNQTLDTGVLLVEIKEKISTLKVNK